MNSTAVAVAVGCWPPFTASQWEELEHQALIFKYLVAGAPVPPELLLPIRRSMASVPARFYHHPVLGYSTYYGKKLDPEPGRCRRTDGKKWRCSKDAHPDSKYCERHMHRSRSRSRKPVESQARSQSQSSSSSSTVTSLPPTGSTRGNITGNFQSIPLQQQQQHTVAGGGGSLQGPSSGVVATASQLHTDLASYGMGSKDYRYPYGVKSMVDEHSFFSEASGSARGLGIDSSLDSSWHLMPSRLSSFPPTKARNSPVLQSAHPQLHSVQDLEQATISSLSKPQQQYSFFGRDFGSAEPVKLESQSLRPFFDEWPRTKDSWSDLEDDRSNRTAFSTTQLSISIPMASSDFSTTTSRSPNDE